MAQAPAIPAAAGIGAHMAAQAATKPVPAPQLQRPHHPQMEDDGAGGFFHTADRFVEPAEKFIHGFGMVQMGADLALPLAGSIVGLVSKSGKKLLNKPYEMTHGRLLDGTKIDLEKFGKKGHEEYSKQFEGKATVGSAINDATMLAFSALSIYGVAKGFSQQLHSLKAMKAEQENKSIDQISTMELLTGHLSPVLAEARSHLLKEHIARGGIQLAGIGLSIRDMFKKGHIGIGSFLLPTFASMGTDFLMAESVLPFYKPLSDAHKSGQPIPPQAYAEFVLAACPKLKARGQVGRMVAHGELSKQYAAENASPAQIVKEIENGRLFERIEGPGGIVERAEKKLADARAAYAAKKAGHPASHHHGSNPDVYMGPMTAMVAGQQQKERPVVGDGRFTGQLQQKTSPEHHMGRDLP